MKKCYIIAGGKFDGFFDKIEEDDLVIAADKGYGYAKANNIRIDYAIGDFDSTNKPNCENIILLNPIKDFTDTVAAIRLAIKNNYEDIIIYGGLGGRESHTLANIKSMFHYKKQGINIRLRAKGKDIFVLDSNYNFKYENYDFYVSIFSLSKESKLDIKGLYYELNDYTMTNDDALGVSNQTNKKDFTIRVKSGTLLVIFEDFSI